MGGDYFSVLIVVASCCRRGAGASKRTHSILWRLPVCPPLSLLSSCLISSLGLLLDGEPVMSGRQSSFLWEGGGVLFRCPHAISINKMRTPTQSKEKKDAAVKAASQ